MFISDFALLVSSFTGSPVASLSISLNVFLLPRLLLRVFEGKVLGGLLCFFPVGGLGTRGALRLLDSRGSFLVDSFVRGLVMIFLFLVALGVVFSFVACERVGS